MNTQTALRYAAEHPEAVQAAQQQMSAVLSRAATDAEFRSRLLSDPHPALAEAGVTGIPSSYRIAFIENKAAATIVLPDMIDPDAELSESELEAVAGGISPTLLVVGFCTGVGLGVTFYELGRSS